MKNYISILSLFIASTLFCQTKLPITTEEINLDGYLKEAFWKEATEQHIQFKGFNVTVFIVQN